MQKVFWTFWKFLLKKIFLGLSCLIIVDFSDFRMFVKCCAFLLLIAGLQLCWAAPAVETQGVDVADNKLVAYSAIPAVNMIGSYRTIRHASQKESISRKLFNIFPRL